MRLKKMLAGAVVALSCMTWSCVSYAGSADAFQWNDKLYNQIIKKTDSLDVQKKASKVFNIADAKYQGNVREITEEYFVHPDGPYTGDNIKKDKEYTSAAKKLIKKTQQVTYYGDAIQAAIDEAATAGGGQVVIPAGTYYTGAIELKSNINLHLEAGAELLFVRNKTNEYYPLKLTRYEGVELVNFSPFVYAKDAKNISISGDGVLNGQADYFNWMPWKYGWFGEENQETQRQQLFKMSEDNIPAEQRVFKSETSTLRSNFIQFYNYQNILLKSFTIKNSPMWEINPVKCDTVLVRNVHIDTNLFNNDGCDPESSKNVQIENNFFNTGDDCIAIKSGRNADGRRIAIPSENIVVRNNHFTAGHGGITIGSEASGGVRNVFAKDNFFDSPSLDYPIRFKTNANRGGFIENVYVKDSKVSRTNVCLIHADFFYEEGHNGDYLPKVRNITIDNFQSVSGSEMGATCPFYLRGFEDDPIENITFKNINITGVQSELPVMASLKGLNFENITINGVKKNDGTYDIGSEEQVNDEFACKW